LTMGQRRPVTAKLAQEYRGADRKTKGRILGTLVGVAGYNRRCAPWLLRDWGRRYLVKIEGEVMRFVVEAAKPQVRREGLVATTVACCHWRRYPIVDMTSAVKVR